MEKNKAKRLKRMGITSESSKKISRRNPKDFFRNIGIKAEGSGNGEFEDLETAILKRNDPKLVEAFKSKKGSFEHFFHDTLDLVKLYYGAQHKHLYRIAEELARLAVPPKSRVLDIGGGPGHLAFWMAKIWDSSVTVADKYSDLGEEWARDIRANNVSFIDALLPDLKPLENEEYDIVILSRVLNFIFQEDLPGHLKNFSTRDFINSQRAKELIDRIEGVLEGVLRALAPQGKVVIIESWSDARVFLVAKAFERKGLFINLDYFSPERLSHNLSLIVFSRFSSPSHIKDPLLALAAVVTFGDIARIGGWGAELVRSFFKVSPTMVLEYASGDERGGMLHELLEQEGLALWYMASTTGGRTATLYPAIEIPRLIEEVKSMGREVEDQKLGNITRQFLNEINVPKETQDKTIHKTEGFEDGKLNRTIEREESIPV